VAGSVLEESSAARAGIKAGDKIISINGEKVERWEDIGRIVSDKAGRVLSVVIDSEGVKKTVTVIPKDNGEGRAIMGITPSVEKEDVSLANFKRELSIYKLTDQGKKRVDNIPEEEGTLESVEGDKNSDYISFVAVRTGLNNFGKREINYSLEGAGIAIKLTIRAELTDMGSCGTAIHIYEVLLNDKKWKPTIGKNKALIYTLKSSMLTVK